MSKLNNLSDEQLRRKVFWITLVIGLCVVGSGYIIEKIASYSLLKYPGIKFGSYGFHLAQVPEKSKLQDKKLIILFGNSVYQYNDVPKYMQQISDAHDGQMAFMNMAQVSTTIYDYLVQAAKIVDTHPDLVVISMNDGTFSTDPKFKTDADQFVFDPDVLKILPTSFYSRYFTYQTAIDSMISTLIPLKRVDPLVRWKLKLRDHLPSWFLKWISYPYLNITTEGERSARTVQMTHLQAMDHTEQLVVLKELVDIFQKQKIPILLIWQETTMPEPSERYKMVKEFVKDQPNIIFTDLTPYFDQKAFVDALHPNREEEPRYARRHYEAVKKALDFLGRNKT